MMRFGGPLGHPGLKGAGNDAAHERSGLLMVVGIGAQGG